MEQEQKQTENTIDLTQLLQICRRHIWALIIWSVGEAFLDNGTARFIDAKHIKLPKLGIVRIAGFRKLIKERAGTRPFVNSSIKT